MTTSDSSAPTSLVNRYGTPKRGLSKKARNIWLLAAAVLSISWVLWSVIGSTTGINNRLLGYNVVDSTMTTVELTVTKDPDATARCAVKALNSNYAVVGWNVITIGPNGTDVGSEGGRTTVVRGDVRTDALAVTGVVEECWIAEGP